MHFCTTHCTIRQPDIGYALRLSPPPRTKLLAKAHDVANFPADRDSFDITNASYDFKVHQRFLLRPTASGRLPAVEHHGALPDSGRAGRVGLRGLFGFHGDSPLQSVVYIMKYAGLSVRAGL